MCGVVGYSSKETSTQDILTLSRIFEQSKIRGLHSCGFSYLDGDRIATEKFFAVGNLMAALLKLEEKFAGNPLSLVGHTRYSTSGDWQDQRNNQPLVLDGISLAFNGCIHMGLREEYEELYGKRYETDNDGEIFCRKVLDGEAWEMFVADGAFSFAGAFLHAGHLTVLRNMNRPLWLGRSGCAQFVASTRDIFARAGFTGELQEVEPCKAFRLTS